jgi:hypothetical protein
MMLAGVTNAWKTCQLLHVETNQDRNGQTLALKKKLMTEYGETIHNKNKWDFRLYHKHHRNE